MIIKHKVKQGECIANIAKKYGFFPDALWNDPNNAHLKEKRSDPNILYPGDVVVIPDKRLKEESGGTEIRHRFRLKSEPLILKLVVEVLEPSDEDEEQGADQAEGTGAAVNRTLLANKPYELVAQDCDCVYSGTTDENGQLEERIPSAARRATLTVETNRWDLDISDLNPLDQDTGDRGTSGMQGRLLNMGFDVGPGDGEFGPRTEAALRQFQAEAAIPETGGLDDTTRAKLIELHGS